MRPAEVWGLATKPASSRSAITLRIVAGEVQAGKRESGRTHRLAVGDVVFDEGLEEGAGALVEHGAILAKPPARRGARR